MKRIVVAFALLVFLVCPAYASSATPSFSTINLTQWSATWPNYFGFWTYSIGGTSRNRGFAQASGYSQNAVATSSGYYYSYTRFTNSIIFNPGYSGISYVQWFLASQIVSNLPSGQLYSQCDYRSPQINAYVSSVDSPGALAASFYISLAGGNNTPVGNSRLFSDNVSFYYIDAVGNSHTLGSLNATQQGAATKLNGGNSYQINDYVQYFGYKAVYGPRTGDDMYFPANGWQVLPADDYVNKSLYLTHNFRFSVQQIYYETVAEADIPFHELFTFLRSVLDTTLSSIKEAIENLASSIGGDVTTIINNIDNSVNQVNDTLTQINNNITSTTEQNQASQDMVDEMGQIRDQIDDMSKQIDDLTNRPPPDSVLPSIPPYIGNPPDDASQVAQTAIKSMFANSIILPFMVMVFTLALVRYVLFGKSK